MRVNKICLNDRRCLLFFVLMISVLDFVSCGPPKRRVIRGEDVLTKTLFYQADISNITYITQGPLDKHQGLDIGICSFEVMHIIDPDNGSLKSKLKFSRGVLRPEVKYEEEGGDFTIIVKGLADDVGLMDKNGNSLWIFKPEEPKVLVNTMAAGDLDKNGELEFYAATNDGLYQLNASGKKVWEKGNDVYYVNIFPP